MFMGQSSEMPSVGYDLAKITTALRDNVRPAHFIKEWVCKDNHVWSYQLKVFHCCFQNAIVQIFQSLEQLSEQKLSLLVFVCSIISCITA